MYVVCMFLVMMLDKTVLCLEHTSGLIQIDPHVYYKSLNIHLYSYIVLLIILFTARAWRLDTPSIGRLMITTCHRHLA